jgi:type IX secretion system PorP/SprF family membrane protein
MLIIKTHILKFLVLLFFVSLRVTAQDKTMNYQVIMISNPALTGSEGEGSLRLSYLNLYPGNSYNLHNVFLSYDSYFPFIHGGAGFYLSDNYLGGIINDLNGGFSYSYHFQAGKDVFINAGLSASFFHRGYTMNGVILPDQIDPLRGVVFPSAETLSPGGKTVFDMATGLTITGGPLSGGISVSHLVAPDLSENGAYDGRVKRQIMLYCTGEISLSRENMLNLRPVAKAELQGSRLSAGAGAVLESEWYSINTLIFTDNEKQTDIQAGFSVSASGMIFFYNYLFNAGSGKNLLPASLMHHTGIGISLNHVDKRKTTKTINFPKM